MVHFIHINALNAVMWCIKYYATQNVVIRCFNVYKTVIIGYNTCTKFPSITATLIINNYVQVSWIATTHQEVKKSSEREKKLKCTFRKSWSEKRPWLKYIEEENKSNALCHWS